MILRRLLSAFCIALCLTNSCYAETENILRDPGFELGPVGQLQKWKGMLWALNGSYQGKAEVIADPALAFDGKAFLRITKEGEPGTPPAMVFDTFRYPVLQSGKRERYRLSAKVRGEGFARIGFQCYDQAGNYLKPAKGQFSPVIHVNEGEDWKEIVLEYLPYDKVHQLSLNLSALGRIDFDNLSLEVEPVGDEKEERKQAELPPTQQKVPSPSPETSPSLKADSGDFLNGSFEEWEQVASIPEGWEISDHGFPRKWAPVVRKTERGAIRRYVHSLTDSEGSNGRYALFLDGRIVSQELTGIRGKRLSISLLAKGEGGRLQVRVRESTGKDANRYVVHLMDILDEPTSKNWQRYRAEVLVPDSSAGPPISAASIEIRGENVIIDAFSASVLEKRNTFQPALYPIPILKEKIALVETSSHALWEKASGSNLGFLNEGGLLATRQPEFRMAASDEFLYFRFSETIPASLVANIKDRDGQLWRDDSFEVLINPTPGQEKPKTCYQFIINSLGNVFDLKTEDGIRRPSDKAWNCPDLQVISKVEKGVWTVELAIPLKQVGISAGQLFGFNICRNFKAPEESANLTGHGYYDYEKMMLGKIGNELPALYWGALHKPGKGELQLFASLFNHTVQPRHYHVTWKVDTEKLADTRKQEINLEGGAQEQLFFRSNGEAGQYGEIALEISPIDGAGKPPREPLVRTAAYDLKTAPAIAQTGSRFLWYPIQRKAGIRLSKAISGKVARVDIGIHQDGRQIVSTSTQNIDLLEDGQKQARVDLPHLSPGTYLLSALIYDQAGNVIEYLTRKQEVKAFDWLGKVDHTKDQIIRPFLPISRGENVISVWGRSYQFAGSGFPEQIISQGEAVLGAPISLAYHDQNGFIHRGKNGAFRVTEEHPATTSFQGEVTFDTFRVLVHGRIEIDGTIFYQLQPMGDGMIPNLRLEIAQNDLRYLQAPNSSMGDVWLSAHPAPGEYIDPTVPVWAPGYRYIPKGLRRHHSLYFPEGDGLIWNSRNLIRKRFQDDFLPYLTFGNTRFGLCWFAENDRGWCKDLKTASYEIVRKGRISTVSIHFISQALKASDAEPISFALAATPVRPKKTGFNEIDWKVIGFGDSSFIDRAFGGLKIKDETLFDLFLQKINPKNKLPILLYNAKAYFPLGHPLFQYFYDEWHAQPERSFHLRSSIPTRKFGLNIDDYVAPAAGLYPERIDFMVAEIEQLIKNNPRLRGIYWDENYSVSSSDPYQRGGGHQRKDGTIVPGTQLFGVRELDRRVQAVLQKYDRPFPNLLVHSTALIPPVYSFADINLTSERGTRTLDFIEYWDLPRLEAALAGAWGINFMWIPQWGQATMQGGPNTLKNNRSMLAALKLFDVNIWQVWCKPELLEKFRRIEKQFGIGSDDSRFFGYWQPENQRALTGLPVDVKASFFARSGKGALIYVSNLNKQKQTVTIGVNLTAWNLGGRTIIDAESGQTIPKTGGTITLEIAGHDFRCLLLHDNAN